MTTPISKAMAERVARAHGCVRCGEYSYKKVKIVEATPEAAAQFKEAWHALLRCGVCGAESELGLDEEGEVLYAN
ncbi:MAG: hypothetical protein HYX65_01930 [Gemmatimonadetes bacterium]|nr:hypothetical protein [Gemmatimonadota bacterium]